MTAGTDFTVTGADGVEFTYLYKTADDEFISGLPTNAGEYTVSAYELNAEKQFLSAEFNITVAKATYDMSNISFADKSVTYDGEEQSLIVSGTLPAGVTVTYEGNGKVNAGEYTVTAKFAGDNANYNAIPDMTATLTIEKGVPSYTAPNELTVSVGQNVADITLPDGWAWTDGTVQFGTAGEHKAVAVYIAADTANYAPVW